MQHTLTIQSLDRELLERLKADVQSLLKAYERTSRNLHTKRGAILARNTITIKGSN